MPAKHTFYFLFVIAEFIFPVSQINIGINISIYACPPPPTPAKEIVYVFIQLCVCVCVHIYSYREILFQIFTLIFLDIILPFP